MKHSKQIRVMVLSAMFLALGLVLPFFTGQIPQIGGMLLPMHIPAFLCGLICGWQFGVVVGFIMPLLRMMLFGMPPLMTAVAMAFELAAYAGIAGFLYSRSRWQCVVALYRSLIAAMIGGRLVWAAVRVVMPGMAFTSASVRKICQVKGTLATPVITTRTAAQTIRPPTIAASRARYRATTHCQRDRLYKKPAMPP